MTMTLTDTTFVILSDVRNVHRHSEVTTLFIDKDGL